MVTAVQQRTRVRLLTVCLLLIGIFGMHGNPAMAPGVCHGAMPVSAPAVHGSTMAPAVPDARSAKAAVVDRLGERGDGQLCLSTPARGWQWQAHPVEAGFLGLLLGAGLALGGAGGRRGSWRRGPPGSGRALLLHVCVARI